MTTISKIAGPPFAVCDDNRKTKPGLTFRIMHRVSATSLIADVVTNNGWMTFFLYMLLMHLSLTLMPALTFPLACTFLNSITINLDGLQPRLLGEGVGYHLEGIGICTEAV